MDINHADVCDGDEQDEGLDEALIPESHKEKERRIADELRAMYPGQWLFFTVSEGDQPYQLIAHGSREEVEGAQEQWSLTETEIVGERIVPSIAMPIGQ